MSAYSLLEPTLGDILRVVNPSNDDWAIRFRIIDKLRAVVESVESLRGTTVEPYGSFVSNLFTRWGDLDISIEIPNGSHISTAGKKLKQRLLQDLMKALGKKGGYHRLQFIANARVPILKFESSQHNISCDISINNLNGQMKSKLLFWINEIDGRFRDMVLLVKEWANAQGINDPKLGTFNSYCISLLVIFHFQTCIPSILPPLKKIYPGNLVDDLSGVRADAEKNIEEKCCNNILGFKSDMSRIINRSSLSELFVSFLGKFSDISSKAPGLGISLYNGQWEDIATNMRWLPKTFALFVEDPFEQPMNVARTVGNRQMTKISEAFQTSHHVLASANQNQSLIISKLARPQISQFMVRMPGYPANNGVNYNMRPQHVSVTTPGYYYPANNGVNYNMHPQQVPRPVRSSVFMQQQRPNLRINERPNTSRNYITAQLAPYGQGEGQGQQSCRPRSNKRL